MNPGGSMPNSQGTIIPIQDRINPIPPINAYLFKMDSNITIPSTSRPS